MSHAKRILQPSSFRRTLNCPGWGNICKDIPDPPATKYSMEGSAAHYLAQKCLERGLFHHARQMLGVKITVDGPEQGQVTRIECTEEMVNAVQVYLDVCNKKHADSVGADFKVEHRIDLGWIAKGMFGTADCMITEPLGCLHIIDYKHGAGVPVDVGEKVGDNPQLTIYALGGIGEMNPHMVEEVEMTIVQPRSFHQDGPVRSIRFEVADLYRWEHDVLTPAVKIAQAPQAVVKAGDWCRWCPAEDSCPELRKKVISSAGNMFDDAGVPAKVEAPPDPVRMTAEQFDRVLEFADVFENWLKAVREEASRRLEQGCEDAPTSMKLVAGRLSNRAWADEDQAARTLSCLMLGPDDLYQPRKLKSPAQIEKTLKTAGEDKATIKEVFNKLLAERQPGNPIMVPTTDGRPALPPKIDLLFDNNKPE